MKNKAAFVTALGLWAESRDRAIIDLNMKAADLADQGCHEDAEYFRFVARLLTVRALHERAVAGALGSCSHDLELAQDYASVSNTQQTCHLAERARLPFAPAGPAM
jgi:hypothetical protein